MTQSRFLAIFILVLSMFFSQFAFCSGNNKTELALLTINKMGLMEFFVTDFIKMNQKASELNPFKDNYSKEEKIELENHLKNQYRIKIEPIFIKHFTKEFMADELKEIATLNQD